MSDSKTNSETNSELVQYDFASFQKMFSKYLFFWKYFIISISISLFFCFLYLRYTPKLYTNTAKIKILDDKKESLNLPFSADFFQSSSINLENEIQLISSDNILRQVIRNLNLNYEVHAKGAVVSNLVYNYPFEIECDTNYINEGAYEFIIRVEEKSLIIQKINNETTKDYSFNGLTTIKQKHDLPFNITNFNVDKYDNSISNEYVIKILNNRSLIKNLKNNLNIGKIGKVSDILSLSFTHNNSEYSANFLNELIDVYNFDGIKDRRSIHKKTIDFVNARYIYLSSELDSIEGYKQFYKSENSIINLELNGLSSLQNNNLLDEQVFENENQKSITKMLLDVLNDSSEQSNILPSNLGINLSQINDLVENYNLKIIERNKLFLSAGKNNPTLKVLDNFIVSFKENIIKTLNNYLDQLSIYSEKIKSKSNLYSNEIFDFPQKEKMLRSIERNQQIKESLYLFLLQKREEAQVNYAVTKNSIKVVDYANSSLYPISPNTKNVVLLAIMLGFLFPFIILYFIFLFDNKVHTREDLENMSLNVLGEIPFFDLPENEKVFLNPEDRSIISESFRMLMSNVRYLQKNHSTSNVILVTSSIKGEGKTLNALNLALSFSSVGKKVLLIGCDLRNPQLHKYINHDKNVPGLVDFLVDSTTEWKKNIINPFDSQPLDLLLSGPLPPNPLNLINNGNIDVLLQDAKKVYDHIIIDSAPVLLVADTQSLINKSDILIFLTRCNVTDNDVLRHIKKVSDESDPNVGVILNGVGQQNSYGYAYGYRYGYAYNYSYNYGYGYGYNEES